MKAPLLARATIAGALPGKRLAPGWKSRYERSRRDLEASDPRFRETTQWHLIGLVFRLMMRGFGLSSFKTTFGRFLSAYEPHSPRYFEALHHVYASALSRRDVWGLLEKLEEPALGDGDAVVVNGRRVSMDLLQSVDEFYRLQETMGWSRNDRVVFCEIGAGYGRLAHVALTAMPNAQYLIFDLPESLLLSQYYLTNLFPEAPSLLYPESADLRDDGSRWRNARIAFGLPHQLKSVPSQWIDAVVNIYSFMEMAPPQVAAYFDVIDALAPRALFLKQHKREINLFESSLLTSRGYPVRPHWAVAHEGTSQLYENVFEAIYRIRE
jgi:putative sugar O-methyltransferase